MEHISVKQTAKNLKMAMNNITMQYYVWSIRNELLSVYRTPFWSQGGRYTEVLLYILRQITELYRIVELPRDLA